MKSSDKNSIHKNFTILPLYLYHISSICGTTDLNILILNKEKELGLKDNYFFEFIISQIIFREFWHQLSGQHQNQSIFWDFMHALHTA